MPNLTTAARRRNLPLLEYVETDTRLLLTLAKVEAKFVKVPFWHTTLSQFNTLI